MKKLLIALLAAAAGYLVWRTYAEDRDERDLWTEVTDDVGAQFDVGLQLGPKTFESRVEVDSRSDPEAFGFLGAIDPIPTGIIDRPPTAELAEGQADANTLGEYEALDCVLKAMIEDRQSPEAAARTLERTFTAKELERLIGEFEVRADRFIDDKLRFSNLRVLINSRELEESFRR